MAPLSPAPSGPRSSHYRGFTTSLKHTDTLGRTALDELSARHRDLYLTTHNTHQRDIDFSGGIRTRKRALADSCLRPRVSDNSDITCTPAHTGVIDTVRQE